MKTFVPAAADLETIRGLLTACDLPASDITSAHLPLFRVARDGDEAVGAVGLELFGAAGLLRSLAVSAAFRGRGLGCRLVDEAEGLARARHVRVLYLLTTTAPAFFERRGYRVVDRKAVPAAIRRTEEFSVLCPGDAICLRRPLDAARDQCPVQALRSE